MYVVHWFQRPICWRESTINFSGGHIVGNCFAPTLIGLIFAVVNVTGINDHGYTALYFPAVDIPTVPGKGKGLLEGVKKILLKLKGMQLTGHIQSHQDALEAVRNRVIPDADLLTVSKSRHAVGAVVKFEG